MDGSTAVFACKVLRLAALVQHSLPHWSNTVRAADERVDFSHENIGRYLRILRNGF
jgi:hypothetical protein